ncbi:ribulose-phosphate 3-epimerase [Deinococcus aerius]|uniref:Ribulose-phosphate 3-epimerase n=2 Tax=Deinococcus TaxID=1298 RepID=A0A2I9CSJ6_9DEIO|nr:MULTISPECIES: ribulose-phosphate 3-epimerase [Deinococcus]MBB5293896.1 ribulose-phosphate 3-epimerase [Deinococcus metallilatus]QBY07158.1 ribulose-phosphate 3-epimerase [Deinococcus metallilatus]RXJ14630.1 ribulose-phosphate 3-epimerase [Deinococcus metallilatus]TLK30750.1 ribulose-phosphate 3-epimerase [Deinococcus metallilatus]GBF04643.1 ribulose-phosphate 3-epimerase [Deinococcus aerius]
MSVRLFPSLLAADFAFLGDAIREAEAGGVDGFHLDVMDGQFVPNLNFGPRTVEACRRVTTRPLEAHLMIVRPERFVPDFVQAGANRVIIHAEATPHLHRAVGLIRELGAQAGVSVNPGTPLQVLRPVLADLDLALVMSVNPGFGGQRFLPGSLERVRTVRRWLEEAGRGAELEVDGGITPATAPGMVTAGATVLVAGSAVFGGNVQRNLNALRAALDAAATEEFP